MTIGRGFKRLAALIDAIEATDVEISGVTVPDGSTDDALLADIQVRIPLDDDVRVSTIEADYTTNSSGGTADDTGGDGSDGAEDTGSDGSDGPDETVETDGDGERVACRAGGCDEVFDTEHGMKIHHTKVHGLSADGSEGPAYHDPDVLREVYAEHDSFTAMTEALGVDVTPQTVRRNMIKRGIHDPHATDDGDTTDEGDNPEAVEATDTPASPESAVDLPDGTTLDDVKQAVTSADTLYEVQQALDLERDEATDLLDELGVLDLVHGRVATKHRRDDLKDEIDERIRDRAPSD